MVADGRDRCQVFVAPDALLQAKPRSHSADSLSSLSVPSDDDDDDDAAPAAKKQVKVNPVVKVRAGRRAMHLAFFAGLLHRSGVVTCAVPCFF